MPKRRPVAVVRPSANASTRQSSGDAGTGASGRIDGPQRPITRPSAPPMQDRRRLSISSCRTRAPRVAPRASRMESSIRRAVARESCRLATLAQTISNTIATTAVRIVTARKSSVLTSSMPRLPESTSSSGIADGSFGEKSARSCGDRSDRNASNCARAECWKMPARFPRTCASGDARLQPAHDLNPPEVRRAEERLLQGRLLERDERLERNGHRDIRRFVHRLLDAREFRRQHADDRDRRVVDAHDRADNVRTAAEPQAPVLLADHGDGRRLSACRRPARWCGPARAVTPSAR